MRTILDGRYLDDEVVEEEYDRFTGRLLSRRITRR